PNSRNSISGFKVFSVMILCAACWNFWPSVNMISKTVAGVPACGYVSVDKTDMETLVGTGCWDESGSEILNNSAEIARIKDVMGDKFATLKKNIHTAGIVVALIGVFFMGVWFFRIKKMVDEDGNSKSYTTFDVIMGLVCCTILINIFYISESAY